MTKVNYSKVNSDDGVKQLCCNILNQAAKDYLHTSKPRKKGEILKFLENNSRLGTLLAEQLRNNPKEVAERLGIIIKEEEKTEEMIC